MEKTVFGFTEQEIVDAYREGYTDIIEKCDAGIDEISSIFSRIGSAIVQGIAAGVHEGQIFDGKVGQDDLLDIAAQLLQSALDVSECDYEGNLENLADSDNFIWQWQARHWLADYEEWKNGNE